MLLRMCSRILTAFFLLSANGLYQACELSYDKVGCYNDQGNSRTFPDLLLNARHDYTENNPGYSVDWQRYKEFLTRFICDCAKAAGKNKYFAVQFYAECWSGDAGPSEFSKYGDSISCVDTSFGLCQTYSNICSGTALTNMIYYVPPVPTNGTAPTSSPEPSTEIETKPTITKVASTTIHTPLTTTGTPTATAETSPATTETSSTTTETPPETSPTFTEIPPTTSKTPSTTTEATPITTKTSTIISETSTAATEAPSTTTETPPRTTQAPSTATETIPTSTKNSPITTITSSTTTNSSADTKYLPTTRGPSPTQTQGCELTTDILLALDVSSSIEYEEFKKRKQLLGRFVTTFPVNKQGVHFALMHYNHYIYTDFTFGDPAFHSIRAVQKAVSNVPLLGGATLTQKALGKALTMFSQNRYGARETSRKVLLIVTDGYTYGGPSRLILPSTELKVYKRYLERKEYWDAWDKRIACNLYNTSNSVVLSITSRRLDYIFNDYI